MKTLVRLVVAWLAVFCVCEFLANFSGAQSATIGAIAALLYWMILDTNKSQRFIPYGVNVQPNLHTLVADLGLVEDTVQGWSEIRAGIDKLPPNPSNIWKTGFTFTFVTPELIYLNDSRRFATGFVELFASLAPVEISRPNAKYIERRFGPYSPSLTLRVVRDADCELVLTLLDSFWEQIKTKDAFKGIEERNARKDHMSGTVDVTLLQIPFQEFAVHNALVDGRYTNKGNAKAMKARNEARERCGWVGKSTTTRYDSEIDSEHSNTAEHKYCTVIHYSI